MHSSGSVDSPDAVAGTDKLEGCAYLNPGLEVSVRSSSTMVMPFVPAFRCKSEGVLAICVTGRFGSRMGSALDVVWVTARDAIADALAR